MLCYLILALCNIVPLSLFPSVQPVAPVGGGGLLKCQGPGFTQLFCSVYHTGPLLLTEEHTFCALLLSLCQSLEAKNLKLCPSNLPRLHLETQSRVSPTSQSSTERSRAKPLLSSCGQSAGRNYFIPSSSSEAEVIYRAAVAGLLAGQQSRAEKSRARRGGGEMR